MRYTGKISRAMTSRKFNRERPFMLAELEERIARAVAHTLPIPLVGFWGIGTKTQPDRVEEETCRFLKELQENVKSVYAPGVDFLFILSTGHAQINGVPEGVRRSYTQGMRDTLPRYGFRTTDLDSLWVKYGISEEKVDARLSAKPHGWWNAVPEAAVLERSAAKRGHSSPVLGAQRYYIMRDLEKEMFDVEFPDSIFHAFSGSRLRSVLPEMPTLYLYTRKNWSDPPWFS